MPNIEKWIEKVKDKSFIFAFEKTPKEDKPTIINNYYLTIDNRVIKVGEKEFFEIVERKKLKFDRKMIEG